MTEWACQQVLRSHARSAEKVGNLDTKSYNRQDFCWVGLLLPKPRTPAARPSCGHWWTYGTIALISLRAEAVHDAVTLEGLLSQRKASRQEFGHSGAQDRKLGDGQRLAQRSVKKHKTLQVCSNLLKCDDSSVGGPFPFRNYSS